MTKSISIKPDNYMQLGWFLDVGRKFHGVTRKFSENI